MGVDKHTTQRKAARALAPSRLSAVLAFDGPVSQVKGVSAGRASVLASWGVRTVRDLIDRFPHRYLDMSKRTTIAAATIGQSCTVAGWIHEIKLKRPKPRLDLVEITLRDTTGTLLVTCFRQPWLADRLHEGDTIALSGKIEFSYGFKRMTNPYLEVVEGSLDAVEGIIIPIHPAGGKLTAAWVRRLVSSALSLCAGLDDPLPLDVRVRYRLMSRQTALQCIHFPHTMDEARLARRRLAYEEVFLLELNLMISQRAEAQGASPIAHRIDGPAVRALAKALPFTLTEEQMVARDEILHRMAAPTSASHMLLGDVGTGKTAVALFALAAAADSGNQALMMAPTEVLADQHAASAGPLLDAAGVSWALLTASTPTDERACIREGLSNGSLTVLFGTHALLEPDIAPRSCSLVVIDEQQRFGVEQRRTLRKKGPGCDYLTLTATPIPRTLALALYGGMTLSYLTKRPRNRAGTTTRVLVHSRRGEAYEIARDALDAGHQVFVVCPLIGKPASDAQTKHTHEAAADEEEGYAYARIAIEDEGDLHDDDIHAAREEARFLQEKIFCGYSVGVLHGRMPATEKRASMERFAAGEVDVLVATTVIEVGIDVPNATVMIVEDADRFGLSQLHQLRGRVGRGDVPGEVCLISSTKNPVALERLAAMERTENGFELAEFDLSLRREGDILGNRQHGASSLRLVNVIRDRAIVETAYRDARTLIEADPDLSQPDHAALRLELSRTFSPHGEGVS